MPSDFAPLVACFCLVAVAGVGMIAATFTAKYRSASMWLRAVYILLGIFALAWSAFESVIVVGAGHISRHRFVVLSQCRAMIAGIAFGLFLSLLFSPEFWRIARRRGSNQSLEPTAGPRDAHL